MSSGIGGHGPLLLGIGWTECALGLFVIGLRIYSASKRAAEFRWDFAWALLACITGIASTAIFTCAIYYGMGNRINHLNLDQIVTSLEFIWIAIFVGLCGGVLARYAIIALLLNITLDTHHKRRIFLWSIAVVTGLAGAAQILLSSTQCTPAAKLWNFVLPGSFCALSAAADVTLALYPITIVWGLKVSRKMKVGFVVLVAGGIMYVLCDRTLTAGAMTDPPTSPAAAGIAKTINLTFLDNPSDITFQFAPFMTLGATELWFIIILGSVPPLRPLFMRWFRAAASSMSRASRGKSGMSKLSSLNGNERVDRSGNATSRRAAVRGAGVVVSTAFGSGWDYRGGESAGKKAVSPVGAGGGTSPLEDLDVKGDVGPLKRGSEMSPRLEQRAAADDTTRPSSAKIRGASRIVFDPYAADEGYGARGVPDAWRGRARSVSQESLGVSDLEAGHHVQYGHR